MSRIGLVTYNPYKNQKYKDVMIAIKEASNEPVLSDSSWKLKETRVSPETNPEN